CSFAVPSYPHLSFIAFRMQLLKSVVYAALAATSLADVHHAHRREADPEPAMEYVTVYNTFYVTAGHEAAAAQTTAVKTTSSEVPAAASTSSEAPAAVTTSEAPAASYTTSPEHTTSSSTSSAAPASTSSSSAGSAGAKGIIYSPYTNSGGCKSSDSVKKDLAQLSGYDIIRLYGTDCNQVANVYAAKAANQKIFAGVYDMSSIDSELETLHSGINGDWSVIETVSIGNELVNDGKATVSDISGYMSTARSKLSSLGYTGSVVSVDTFIAVINNPGLCDLSDYMAVNAHAYFDGGVTSSQAGSWANEQIDRVWSACSGNKSVTIVESGWPSQGATNGKAVCSESDQKAAISSLKSNIGNDVFLFTAYNDLWKTPGEEQWWGIYGTSQNQ
ncbi:hypothetical protein EGM85_10940, partial [Macrococcus caseolyticus]